MQTDEIRMFISSVIDRNGQERAFMANAYLTMLVPHQATLRAGVGVRNELKPSWPLYLTATSVTNLGTPSKPIWALCFSSDDLNANYPHMPHFMYGSSGHDKVLASSFIGCNFHIDSIQHEQPKPKPIHAGMNRTAIRYQAQ